MLRLDVICEDIEYRQFHRSMLAAAFAQKTDEKHDADTPQRMSHLTSELHHNVRRWIIAEYTVPG